MGTLSSVGDSVTESMKLPHQGRSLAYFVLSITLSGCVLARGQSLKAESAPPVEVQRQAQVAGADTKQVATDRVAPHEETTPSPWHKLLVEKLSNEPGKYKDAWALFSSGGWADAGQILVLGDKDSGKYHVYTIKPGGTEIGGDHDVTAADFNRTLAPAIKAAADLSDLAPVAFDALTYYYEHASVGADGKVVIVKRLIIRETIKVRSAPHMALVAAFQKLR